MYSLLSESALNSRARRAAKRIGLTARKSRRQVDYLRNCGGFVLLSDRNWIVAGSGFDLSAQDVIDYCEER
jgi:hypothetical protein